MMKISDSELTQSSIAPFWLAALPNSRALCPVINSRRRIPKPKTSVFSEDCPVERYSGAMCPTVPLTAVVTCESWWSKSFASPKSPTTASQYSSSNMFAAFTSLCIIFGSHCSWRYNKPRAAPKAILFLVPQSKIGFAAKVR